MKPPRELDKIVDVVLAYRPKPKSKAAKKRKRKAAKREKARGVSSIPCPMGCGGVLRYSVASYNGHMHGACTTKGCVSWMQ